MGRGELPRQNIGRIADINSVIGRKCTPTERLAQGKPIAEKGDEDIFPDPASQGIAEGWRNGVVKAMEHQFAAFAPSSATDAA
jgi:hypothetical protein